MDGKLPIQFSSEEIVRTIPPTHYGSIAESPNVFGADSQERRASMRFVLEMEADISTSAERFRARTINISSGGLLLTCSGNVEIGTLVTVRIAWPLQQRNKRITLIVHGEIIRRDSIGLAVRQQRHEFEVSPQTVTSHATSVPLSHNRRFLSSALDILEATCRWMAQSINCPPFTSTVSPTT